MPKTANTTFVRDDVLADYRLAYRSRQASLIGRREVLSGKAKFGIFGDGKELAQIAMARAFQPGDFRSGYYRDQTFMLAIGEHTLDQFFAQLFANTDLKLEPATGGRAMNAHFATRSLNADGSWKAIADQKNSSSDISPTAAQMPRLVGLAHASKLYREVDALHELTQFSRKGNEVAFGTIGNASSAEGMFWEAVNAIGVLQAPAVLSIWDDGYGISVPNEHQLTADLSRLLSGFQRSPGGDDGYDIYTVPGWDYVALMEAYAKAAATARHSHVPAILHITEVTQPQGHSTSGSHERYKTAERLQWEQDYDCLPRFRNWIVEQGFATEVELDAWENEDRHAVEATRAQAWDAYTKPILQEMQNFADMLVEVAGSSKHAAELTQMAAAMQAAATPLRQDMLVAYRKAMTLLKDEALPGKPLLVRWKQEQDKIAEERYASSLYTHNAERVPEVKAVYSDSSPLLNGFEIVNKGFNAMLARDPRVVAFGEDLGYLGDVNQGFAGLQEIYGKLRVADTGIREATIMGQAIGMALRGLRPIAEIQYLDYLLYGLQILSDDVATLHWRTKGGQKAPLIVRTRGHRLEGIWHSGSLMAGALHLLRGMLMLVPRNMTQAVGFYNTLLAADEPAIVVEVLNGYRLKERLPDNIAEFTVPVGVPEVLREGKDVTIVTYGPLCRIAGEAADALAAQGIEVELIDVQSLMPFDLHGRIVESLQKTNRALFLDEDVPGGTSAFMMQEVLETQGGYQWLDSAPRTLTGKAHRAAYGSDGNYWSKPNVEDIFYTVYRMMHEAQPQRYPLFF
ncbi:MAG TPA: thiamine pyrophosphate-dependent enzyme [Anaerolineales bacterium]|nr:thiamine pyrophosphate-dependent enzyme [Anaerolineales bacterium]HRQ93091.1 thiamine pyrophosphate-dependent enzyme [Anaerolineales bacterium]